MFTSRSEEVHEERRSEQGPKSTRTSPPPQYKKPKFEEFRKETRGQPESYGPYSEDTYYAMKDESDISTGSARTQKKVEVKSETHVAVMSDKKVEVYETTSVDVSPGLSKKSMATEKKMEKIIVKETPETRRAKPDPEQKHFDKKKPGIASSKTTHLITETAVQQGIKQEFIKKTESATAKPASTTDVKVPKITPLKSTELVMRAVTKHEQEKEELDLKPFPFQADPGKPKKPRGAPPPQPSKFIKGEFRESDYDSDYEGRIPVKWKPLDSDTEEINYSAVKPSATTTRQSQPRKRTPTPPTVFDKPPQFEGPPRPKIDFPESETEPEREISPEIVLPEKIETLLSAEIPKIVPKEPKVFKSQPKPSPPPPPPPPPRSPSPVLKPGTPPEEDYIQPPLQPKPAPFTNAIGVESTKITKIADSSKYHQRFVSMQQTTRVIKFSDSRTAPPSTESQQQPKPQQRPKPIYKEQEQKPLPNLEPFPFTPEAPKPKKARGQPPPMPKKFQKSDATESDYESDYEGRIKPKWQPTDSDAEDPNYSKVKPTLKDEKKPSKSRERTPTPPTAFEVPPETGGLWRPVIEPSENVLLKEPSPVVIIPKVVALKEEIPKKAVTKERKMIMKTPEKSLSPPLPSPGPTPEEGVIIQEMQYVIDKVDVKSKVKPPPQMEVQTYIDKPYTKITERTEKTFTKMKMEEEMRMKRERLEKVKTTVIEYEDIPTQTPATVQSELKVEFKQFPDLEPFPFERDLPKPKRERGPPPPKPSKFVKGEFRESDYDSDYEGKVRPKWKPADSDVEDPEYTPVRLPLPATKQMSQERERTPTPPSKFDVPPETGGPLRPTIDHIERLVEVKKEKSPEIVIPKIDHATTKSVKIRPKAPALKSKEPKPDKPREPTPPLPEPGPEPEIGYVPGRVSTTQEGEEDAHIRMIKKKIESKKGFEIDIDITDIYDFVSESDHDKTDTESSTRKPFPKLEPFPYEPDPARPKRQRGPPPPHPKKFLKGEFRESDYESDYDAPIAPKWVPPESEGDEYVYRRVAPPTGEIGRQRSESTGREPSPPSKFDQPPHFEGPPRPIMELSDLPRRERRESLEEYSIPRFPKVEFKPFDLDDDVTTRTRGGITTDTETEPELQAKMGSSVKGGIDKKYAKTAQKVVSHQFEDMTQTFRHKAQKFAEQLVTEVFAAREGSVPAEPAGEPPSLPEELKTCSVSPDSTAAPPVSTTAEITSPGILEPQAYRDESRVSEFGTKHIDPDTGLIYFKYDFGYEFGVILPGEVKKVEKKKGVNGDCNGHIPIPVIHEKSDSSKTKGSEEVNGHTHSSQGTVPSKSTSTVSEQKDSPKILSSQSTAPEQVTSPQPSLQSDISETDREYQQYMGKMIPEFVPKKQAQFRPISGDPYSDSEGESEQPSPAKIPEASPSTHVGPKRFVPLVPGATVQPKPLPLEGTPADALYTTTELGASSRSHSGGGRGGKTGVRGSGRSSRPSNVVQRGPHPTERT